MAIYHFSAKVISRANGSSAVASAAYRSASELQDERLGRAHDFSNKAGVVHSEVLLPKGAPERLTDRATLWNEVETGEKRKDAQLAREVEFAIPREMNQAQGVQLAQDFVEKQFVKRGMVADLNVHWDIGKDGQPKPHAHVMLSMREVGPDGFGKKVREWNGTELLKEWREAWEDHVNERLAELDIDARIDHRTLAAQGIDLEPQHKIGPAGSRRLERGEVAERAEDHVRIARENGEKIIANPSIALDAVTRQQATFTTRDLAMFVHRHSDGKAQFDEALRAVRFSPELVALGVDGKGNDRFTSRDMMAAEQRLESAADRLGGQAQHGLADRHRDDASAAAEARGLVLSTEQRGALEHITGREGLASVVGYAGTGKSAMLGVAREAWEGAGYQVYGVALSGIAAENLESGSGIASRTIAALEYQWEQGREQLSPRDVLVIDEAGMIGTRQMERVLSHAADAGAKVVLVGDPEQLQAIEAGAAFRSLAERHGWAEIGEIRRQRDPWQRDATKALATGRTGEAVHAYEQGGMVHAAETREQARAELIDRWDAQRRTDPDQSRIILTHTNAEVRDLNLAARERLRDAGELGADVGVAAERGARDFASGDRIMFLKNERGLGVKNGTLGRIETVSPERMAVRLDDGRRLAFYFKDYAHVDHGYAATIHKSQGVTVDRTHVLATPGMDRHSAYVALSRHRDGVQLHYGRDDFADQRQLVRTLGRERAKDMASDYARDADGARRAFAGLRGLSGEIRLPDSPKVGSRPGMFDGLRLSRASSLTTEPAAADRTLARAVERVARATGAISQAQEKGAPVLKHQKVALEQARTALDQVQPNASRDMSAAIERNPGLAREAASGRSGPMLAAMAQEARLRADPHLRAAQFVERWQGLQAEYRTGDRTGRERAGEAMAGMAKSLERDPQMEAVLRGRARELGLEMGMDRGRDLGRQLTQGLGLGRDRGLER
ncbi:Ti-type conjugative transfer relaxase TraA [Sphingomonadales bacterium 56]|uniref:Ti-type conjugative transfer relaxase TraA n=1 Tax=unclassified Sphingobium TaxID=2611147 RepID=UPI00191938A7|nr:MULTISPECIES: Ti-type conjugative transfer relaxase TraA [unclassified Sphingobium]MBY2930536.1 Ti-type conjugative transfer relaxase TraA [Sphingomonadales bacterium 56]MBY2960665.1 Ti-type conjugative transfer relaxase TraA [Sphingomonadales bacterium 58]CAD7341505.1 ATP-dependent RecD-like DNA helicase [Sphingobium sp. S6]CAD7341716.1 ATP-dependent RecD-like DNA helicase [Sphingobium sp. S8]